MSARAGDSSGSGPRATDPDAYFPEPAAGAGWRRCRDDGEIRALAGMDPAKLQIMAERLLTLHAGPWASAIVRRGYLLAEWFGIPALATTTFDVWSCTKSFTSIAFGMLIGDSRAGRLPLGRDLDLDSFAYALLDESLALSDPRKRQIEVRQLLSMTSGVAGEAAGIIGIAAHPLGGPFEIALGTAADRFGRSVATLHAEPGAAWDYSDPGFAHLSLIFKRVAGRELHDFLDERLFRPLGITYYGWDVQGGAGFLGPHTNAHTGLRIAAADLARVGYLLLRRGFWGAEAIVPEWWLEIATNPSQQLNRNYGYGFWSNADGTLFPGLPGDAFAMQGFAANRCYVIPSLDLVVTRVGYGPASWSDAGFLGPIVAAIVD